MIRTSSARRLIAAGAFLSLAFSGSAPAALAGDLAEPPVLASKNGALNLLMVARAAPISTFPDYSATGWVFDICERPARFAATCPASDKNKNPYAGVRLQLRQGDLLKVRLVNALPPIKDSGHATEPGHAFLALDPINIHTHGMLVSPHGPGADGAYGDNVFVMTLNPKNGPMPADSHAHSDVRYGYTDYSIKIPAGHPSGLFWFHPHIHGIALNQVSAGLSGIITVGALEDYVCKNASCASFFKSLPVRHIILKDAQILKDGVLLDEEEPSFCDPAQASGEPPRKGSCPGVKSSDEDGGDYTGGRWYFTLNGQPYPSIPVKSPGGEIWRITTASGSVSYDLGLWNPKQQRNMVVQVLSVDGVAVQPGQGISLGDLRQIGGAKVKPVACPGITSAATDGAPLCVRRLLMMPSSRVELWVTYRDADDRPAQPSGEETAILRTAGFETGPDGDSWPAIDLANVQFKGSGAETPAPQALTIAPDALTYREPTDVNASLLAANTAVGVDPSCHALPQGHSRRVFFNAPTSDPDAFGLGYEELDAHGAPVPGTFMDVKEFDPSRPTICLPLGPRNTPVHEKWELVNLAGEDHNFHIHQVKFRLLTHDEISGAILPGSDRGSGILHDNIPLQHADGVCNSVADWRNGACTAHPVTVDIPFAIAGDFVYHCHILEHEDGGMMARIRVRPSNDPPQMRGTRPLASQ
ncbi:multicopper oxidase family protein [Methylocapsa palsarum]|uniref:Multicopper oxidase with three cupredoxin domains (Includes cell division protein FtsP and spore coat protein CotA) n=1 Tax=Methylocapsa palsarum TaxID=1612308 RepID=A0A1I3WY09_9HYPH|nr:multicopper oxidase domain-containing protein [Methylocapsa palsarum]SFK12029.1 Multicopper oxidase with three cupredoxin domains (includes cell division protein FtsP and spore coat protein CotA) [Methylocapsa palsarum]